MASAQINKNLFGICRHVCYGLMILMSKITQVGLRCSLGWADLQRKKIKFPHFRKKIYLNFRYNFIGQIQVISYQTFSAYVCEQFVGKLFFTYLRDQKKKGRAGLYWSE